MRKAAVVACIALAAGAAALYLAPSGGGTREEGPAKAGPSAQAPKKGSAIADARPKQSVRPQKASRPKRGREKAQKKELKKQRPRKGVAASSPGGAKRGDRAGAAVGKMSAAEKAIADAIENAVGSESFQGVVEAAKAALASGNAELRGQAVEALSGFGAKALPTLAGMISAVSGDALDDVLSATESLVMDIEDPAHQFGVAAEYMKAFSGNEEALATFSSLLANSGNDLSFPGDDSAAGAQAAASGRETVVKTIQSMVESGGALAREAKDAYEFITGNEWVNADEAARWAADPDNYEAPDLE